MQAMLDTDWPRHTDALANFYISSPCQRIRVGFLPEGDDNGLWKTTVASYPFSVPRWTAVFDGNVPAEVVSAFTTALVADYADGREHFLYGAPQGVSMAPLLKADWEFRPGEEAAHVTAPDQSAGVTVSRVPDRTAELLGGTTKWTLWGGPEHSPSRWRATFTSDAPEHLVAATANAMADPAPVVRAAVHIPQHHLDQVHTSPAPAPWPQEERRARAARPHTGRPASGGHTPPPPTPPTAGPTPPRTRPHH